MQKLQFTSFPSSSVFDQDYSNYFYYNDGSDLWYRLSLENWEELEGSKYDGQTYCMEVCSISMEFTSLETIRSAMDYCDLFRFDAEEITPFMVVQAIFEYQSEKDLSVSGNNYKDLLKQGRQFIR